MGILIGLALFGVLCGVSIKNRAAAILGAMVAGVSAWFIPPALEPMLGNSVTGRRWATLFGEWGVGSAPLPAMLGAVVLGVLVAWVLFRAHEHRPDWEWDPEHPRFREKRRRRRRYYDADAGRHA
ncbi:MAG: hypothetical protein K1X35_10130 [Caulobacteraceae bacterium]|nr:hypothetical protein [Caulobacteraceae bacterium]